MGVSTTFNLGLKSKEKTMLPIKKRRRPKHSVRFNDAADQVIEVPTTTHLAEKSTLWWTKEERQDILDSNQRLASDFRSYHRDQVQRCKDVFDECCLSDDDDDDDSSSEEEMDFTPKLPDLPTQLRGLEWGIVPASKRYRRTHVQQVLKAQKDLQQDDRKARLLSMQAIRSSRPSRVMARILGESDAAGAKDSCVLRRNRCRMLPSWW